ncbi:MAG: hypothetical protein Q9187_001724 [Circinaria calcarea]
MAYLNSEHDTLQCDIKYDKLTLPVNEQAPLQPASTVSIGFLRKVLQGCILTMRNQQYHENTIQEEQMSDEVTERGEGADNDSEWEQGEEDEGNVNSSSPVEGNIIYSIETDGCKTAACGIPVPAKFSVPIKPMQVQIREGRGIIHKATCCICNGTFSQSYTIKSHFLSCVRLNGNPEGKSWNDHPSLANYKPRPLKAERIKVEADDGATTTTAFETAARPPTPEYKGTPVLPPADQDPATIVHLELPRTAACFQPNWCLVTVHPSMNNQAASNYAVFRDCFSSAIFQTSHRTIPKSPKRRGAKGGSKVTEPLQLQSERHDDSAEQMAEFSEFLATEVFDVLPHDLQTLSFSAMQADSHLAERYTDPVASTVEAILPVIPTSVTDSIEAYHLIPSTSDLSDILTSVLTEYINATTRPPPIWSNTRASACEICDRDWIPLTYHHLIPRQMHAKALKRNWHEAWRLNSVAWLCRACHSFVHRVASNEELARDWWTVELLTAREDVQAWATWVGRVRWKST